MGGRNENGLVENEKKLDKSKASIPSNSQIKYDMNIFLKIIARF